MSTTYLFRTMRLGRAKAFFFGAALMAALLFGLLTAKPAHAVTFTVNSTADTGDATPDGTCDTCTLREAIQEANFVSGADTINFAIPGAGPHTISPNPELPDIDDPLTIDGYTEALGEATPATPNTLAFGTNAVGKTVISGASAPLGSDGFDVEAGPTTIRGLVINGFKAAANGSSG
jgi:trimeric autotransporter adhesin